jgi:hypothetical protein
MNLYVDGWWGGEKELTVIPRPKFPFSGNPTPDTYSRAYERDFQVYPRTYIPPLGLLLSWENLIPNSEDFTQAGWTKTNATATANFATAPDGLASMNRLLETVTNGEHAVSRAATVTAAPFELSVFARAGLTRRFLRLGYTDSAATAFTGVFDVEAGQFVTLSAGVTADVAPLGGRDYRLAIRFTPAAGAGTFKINIGSAVGTFSYAGNTANGVLLWGAQLTAGVRTPYISTTTAARTIIVPARDTLDPFAFLVREDDPQPSSSEAEVIRRGYARVPLTQIVPSFIRINKPAPGNSFPAILGQYVINQPDSAVASYNAFLRQTVIADSGPDIGVGGGLVTGGTYALEFDGDTTADIAWNAPASLVQSALNALTSVQNRGGCTVSGDNVNGFTIVFAAYALNSITFTPGGSATYFPVDFPNTGAYYQGMGVGPGSGTPTSFTVTIFGQTTGSISMSASSGAIQAALNALSEVADRGGVTVTQVSYGTNGIYFFSYVFTNALITVDGTNLTPAGSTGIAARIDPFTANATNHTPGRQQSLQFTGGVVGPRTVQTQTAHGIAGTEQIYAKAGEELYFLEPGQYSVIDADEIEFDADSGTIATTSETITDIGKIAKAGYTPGTANVRCVLTTTYYLPNYTPGITTAEDIVPPTYQGDPDTMLQLIFSGQSTINYDVGELVQWRGMILSLTVVTIRASDL